MSLKTAASISDELAARLSDCISISEKRPCFLGFLTEEQQELAGIFLKKAAFESFLFFGGYDGAERKLIGFFPQYAPGREESFPLSAVSFYFRKAFELSHRDMLGAMMGLGIERSTVGDILIESGRAVCFVRSEIKEPVKSLKLAGRVGLRAEERFELPLPQQHIFKEISGVIASARLDCAAALMLKTSREKASGLIEAGRVAVNHVEAVSCSRSVEENDVVTVRGEGKFIIDKLGPYTKKGRLCITARKYM